MSIIDKVISSQVIDQFKMEPGWRKRMEIPLRLEGEEMWSILQDTKNFVIEVNKMIEVGDISLPAPTIKLKFNADGRLTLTIDGFRWRFKNKK